MFDTTKKVDESVKKGGTSDSVAMSHASSSSSELAAISIQARLPEFWPEMPRLWFAQVESILAPQKQSDEANFNVVVAKLGRDALQQISDILLTPPETEKYKAVKERLLQAYEESAERQFQKLVSELELGSQRPTQLLRRMRELGRTTQVAEQTLKGLWMSRMPPPVRAVLAVCPEQGLDNLAAIADKVVENSRPYEVAAVSNNAEHGTVAAFTELAGQMNRLMLEVASLRNEVRDRGRGRERNTSQQRNRSRSASRQCRQPGDPGWLCTWHYRYRTRATRCEKPCAWKTPVTASPPAEN